MINKIKSFFGIKHKKPTLMFYDSDQVSRATLKAIHLKTDHSKTRSIWVANQMSKTVSMPDLENAWVSSVAKEAVDIAIAAISGVECNSNKNLKEIIIVSSDGDSLGTAITLANMYQHVTFRVYAMNNRPLSKAVKAATKDLPKNVSYVRFRCI